MLRKSIGVALTAILASALFACGGENGSDATTTGTESPAPTGQVAATAMGGGGSGSSGAAADGTAPLEEWDRNRCALGKIFIDAEQGSLVANMRGLRNTAFQLAAGPRHEAFAQYAEPLDEAEQAARRAEGGSYLGHEATPALVAVFEDLVATCRELGWEED